MAEYRLLTLAPSHFSEKARWALDYYRLPYREERHAPLIHRIALKRAGAQATTVPFLIHGQTRLSESAAILAYLDERRPSDRPTLFPAEHRAEIEAFCERADREFGRYVPRWAYSHILDRPPLFLKALASGLPGWESWFLRLAHPLVRTLMRKGLRISTEAGQRSRTRMTEFFLEVSNLVSDGRPYLFGDSFSAADLTMAALAGPVVAAPQFGGSVLRVEELPDPLAAEVQLFQATAAGAFVTRIYAQHR